MMKCPNPNCNETDHEDGAKFCHRCGTQLVSRGHAGTTGAGNKRPSVNPVLVFQNNSTGVSFKMIKVDGGTFYMGVTPKEAQKLMSKGVDWRKKYPLITLKSYYIGETVVTQALWKAVMNQSPVTQAYWQSSLGDMNNPSRFKGDNLPVENVSWNNCQEFIRKLNELLRFEFRLPTEAEWEFASKGGNLSKGCEFSGSNDLRDVAWVTEMGQSSYSSTTKPVKTKLPNELGLYDMTGNVWEWCEGTFDEEYVKKYGNNEIPEEYLSSYIGTKILKGFSAFYYADTVEGHPSIRKHEWANLRNPSLYENGQERDGYWYDAFGFRLALSLE